MAAAPRSPGIGLALGGGAAQGFAHVAVLEALDELGVRPAAIAGTSMGAVLGAVYAAGMSGAEIRRYATELFRRRSEFLARLWTLRPRRLSEISFGVVPYDIEKALRAFLPPELPQDFAGLGIPFKAVAVEFYTGREVVLSTGPLVPAIAASAAVPLIFRPVVLDGRVMIDGGICNPVPFDVLGAMDFIIASDVVGLPAGNPDHVPGALQSGFGSVSLVLRAILTEKLKNGRPPDLMVRPPTGSFGPLDFTKAAAIIRASEPAKNEVKRRIAAALEAKLAL